jgi:hypothetical protein
MCNKRLPEVCAIKGCQMNVQLKVTRMLPEVCVIKGYQKYV